MDNPFCLIILSLLFSYSLLLLGKALLVIVHLNANREATTSPAGPSIDFSLVTICQPILSGDPLLRQTLENNLRHLPKDAAFLWLLDDDDGEAMAIAKALQHQHTNLEVLRCPTAPNDVNPKSFKLQRGLGKTERPLLAVLDDDTTISRETLAAAIEATQTCHLYTGLPCYRPARNRWGQWVEHFVNGQALLTYLPPLRFGDPITINGMFYVLRRSALIDAGGFQAIQSELCDDYAMAKLGKSQAWNIQQGVHFQQVATSVGSAGECWRLFHRWMLFARLLVQDQHPLRQTWLVCMLGLGPGLLSLAALASLAGLCLVPAWRDGWGMIALAWLLTLALRHATLRYLQYKSQAPISRFKFLPGLASEFLLVAATMGAALNRTIQWRSKRIRVGKGMQFKLIEIDKSDPNS